MTDVNERWNSERKRGLFLMSGSQYHCCIDVMKMESRCVYIDA